MGDDPWLLPRLQVRHQHVNVKVLALEQAQQASLVARLIVAYADDLRRAAPQRLRVELLNLLLIFLGQRARHGVVT